VIATASSAAISIASGNFIINGSLNRFTRTSPRSIWRNGCDTQNFGLSQPCRPQTSAPISLQPRTFAFLLRNPLQKRTQTRPFKPWFRGR
jgi:hypothetical protein